MGKVIAIANQKGGVGKTTTTVNLGAALAHLGHKVLIIDSDSQGNATSGLGAEPTVDDLTLYEALVDEVALEQIIIPSSAEKVDLVPANMKLAAAELEMATLPQREQRLKRALVGARDQYDFILIDCPPSLGQLSLNAFTASDTLMITVQAEYFALEGLTQLLNTIHRVQQSFNPQLRIEGVLITMFDARTNLAHEVEDEVRKYFQEKVYQTTIGRNVRLSEAPSYGLSIMDYDRHSSGAKAYLSLAKEVLANDE